MSTTKRYLQDEASIAHVEGILRELEANLGFHTSDGYSSNSEDYPDNVIPFVQKHMRYLNDHPQVNPEQYLSNLRLMIKVR